MKLPDVIELGFDNLRQARLRTLLTTMGVSIGVSALVGMVSLGAGLQDNLNARLLHSGFFQTMMVFPRFDNNNNPADRVANPNQGPRILDDTALTAMRQIPGVQRVEPDVRLFLQISVNGKDAQAMAVAVPKEDGDEAAFQEMPYGKFFTAEDADEVILNTQMAKDLGFTNPNDLVGKTVHATIGVSRQQGRGAAGARGGGRLPSFMGGDKGGKRDKREATPAPAPPVQQVPQIAVDLKVVGLTSRERAMLGNVGAQIYLPFGMAQAHQEKFFQDFPMLALFRPPGYQGASVHLASARDVESVEKTINTLGFRTLSIASAISQLKRVFVIVDMLLAFVGSIGMAVAFLGITNTMVMAVLERTREIGVMKAIGAEDQDIRWLFLSESAVIGAMGGVIGLIFAWILGRVINFGANQYIVRQGLQKENLFLIPLWLIGSAMAFSVFVSICAGLYPADRAARIDPTRALRHD
jgi:putative ABC transport system permease protein